MVNLSTDSDMTIRSPGRICLYGDHQDYLGLPVITCAINRYITLCARRNGESVFRIELKDLDEVRWIELSGLPKGVCDEGDFLLAAIHVLEKHGYVPHEGYDVVIEGDIPINSGLSSSSAFTLAWIAFLMEAIRPTGEIDRFALAELAYETEVVYFGSGGGRMDQYAISMGEILYLETDGTSICRSFEDPGWALVVAESGVPKDTSGVLRGLKKMASQAIEQAQERCDGFQLRSSPPRSVMKACLERLDADKRVYLEAALSNFSVTARALAELDRDTPKTSYLGALMNEHHAVLRDCLDVSLPAIEKIVTGALEAGAMGAKIVGSGRGGCIAAICEKGVETLVVQGMLQAGAKDAYAVEVSKGVLLEK